MNLNNCRRMKTHHMHTCKPLYSNQLEIASSFSMICLDWLYMIADLHKDSNALTVGVSLTGTAT